MSEIRVADVSAHSIDSVGTPIETVYSRDVPLYAVYRTAERVLIHYADELPCRHQQRQDLAPLSPLRGEINGLIDGWRSSTSPYQLNRARRFDRRVADALTLALQNDIAGATVVLEQVKRDIVAERTSWARFLYLMIALGTVLSIIVLAGFITTGWFAGAIHDFGLDGNLVWLGAGVGAVGAFFSIALAIRNRTILTDLQLRDNAADAVLRVVVGAIAGALVILIILSEAIGLSIGGSFDLQRSSISPSASPRAPNGPQLAMLLGFVAGFSERLVTDLLAKVTPAEMAVQARVAAATGAAAPVPNPAPSPPTGGRAPDPVAPSLDAPSGEGEEIEDDMDCCAADIEMAEDEATIDAELPPASGGVERTAG